MEKNRIQSAIKIIENVFEKFSKIVYNGNDGALS